MENTPISIVTEIEPSEHGFGHIYLAYNGQTNIGFFFGDVDHVLSTTGPVQMTAEQANYFQKYQCDMIENEMDPANPWVYNYSINLNEYKDGGHKNTNLVSFHPISFPEPLQTELRIHWLKEKIDTLQGYADSGDDVHDDLSAFKEEIDRLKSGQN